VEWVPGNRWWIARLVVPLVVLGVFGVILFALWQPYPSASPINTIIFLAVDLLVIAVVFAWISIVPSVRRIGLSPAGLIVDNGASEITYAWSDVTQVTRTRINRFTWSQVKSTSRTSITLNSGLSNVTIALTLRQGERLANFLRIP